MPVESNLLGTRIHSGLARLLDNYVLAGDEAYVDKLVLQVDNTTSEHRHSVVFEYLAFLVRRKNLRTSRSTLHDGSHAFVFEVEFIEVRTAPRSHHLSPGLLLALL